MAKRGKLVVIEGVDHLGKSEMTNRFISKHRDWIYQHQPDDSNETTAFVRKLVKSEEPLTPFENQLLHCWSHCFHYRFLHDMIYNRRVNVLLDRFYLSALAYGSADGLDISVIKKLEEAGWGDLPVDGLIYFHSTELYPKWMKKDKSTLEDARYENKGDQFRQNLIASYENQLVNFKFKNKLTRFNVDNYNSIDKEYKDFERIVFDI